MSEQAQDTQAALLEELRMQREGQEAEAAKARTPKVMFMRAMSKRMNIVVQQDNLWLMLLMLGIAVASSAVEMGIKQAMMQKKQVSGVQAQNPPAVKAPDIAEDDGLAPAAAAPRPAGLETKLPNSASLEDAVSAAKIACGDSVPPRIGLTFDTYEDAWNHLSRNAAAATIVGAEISSCTIEGRPVDAETLQAIRDQGERVAKLPENSELWTANEVFRTRATGASAQDNGAEPEEARQEKGGLEQGGAVNPEVRDGYGIEAYDQAIQELKEKGCERTPSETARLHVMHYIKDQGLTDKISVDEVNMEADQEMWKSAHKDVHEMTLSQSGALAQDMVVHIQAKHMIAEKFPNAAYVHQSLYAAENRVGGYTSEMRREIQMQTYALADSNPQDPVAQANMSKNLIAISQGKPAPFGLNGDNPVSSFGMQIKPGGLHPDNQFKPDGGLSASGIKAPAPALAAA